MLIKDLFQRDIARSINGVVKADQLDDSSIWQELDEYVVTKELDGHFRRFFEAYLASVRRGADPELAGQIGIWVSGFFGSGKSHFIKILSYLIQNREVEQGGQKRRAVEFFREKISDPMLFADIQKAVSNDTDVVLFNIDSKANPNDGRAAILNVFLRVFNEMLGFSGDHPHIAHMERFLLEKKRLDQFKAAYQAATGALWDDERDAFEFNLDEVEMAFAEATWQSPEASREWLRNAEKNFPLTPENFARWVRDYLDTRGTQHRIVFFVDEVGQFIGNDTHLMLSLQTIVENLGTFCGGRAWVVVTSQENIEAILGEVRATQANDFSKIQGRFRTRLSLSSANTDEVIQTRLLSKTDAATAELTRVFASKGDILRSQLSFTNLGMTFPHLGDAVVFSKNYPFVPYQFPLVQKIFEQIRKHGATGLHLSRGERSMLDAFQLAGKNLALQSIGALAPLYRFYPAIESFLDTAVKRTIDQTEGRGLNDFDREILRVLFLVRYIEEFRANIDNLVTLCIDEIDADRLGLKRKIEDSLGRLEQETLISRNGENYFFLTNEERDISQEIKDVELNGGEQARKLGELLFEGSLRGTNKHRFPDNKKDFGFNRYCDRHPVGQILSANELEVSVVTPLADEYELYGEARCILESSTEGGKLLIKLKDNRMLGEELRLFLKTEKYIKRKNDDTLPATTKRILRDRADENRVREERLTKLLDELLLEAEFFVNGQSRSASGSSATVILSEQLTYLIRNTFTKLAYLKALKNSPDDCRLETRSVLTADSVGQQELGLASDNANQAALDDVRAFIQLNAQINQPVVLRALVERYGKRPYGWPEYEVILLVARLLALGEISLIADGATVPVEKAFEPLTKPQRWSAVTLVRRQRVDAAAIEKARRLGMDVFSEMGPEAEEPLAEFLRGKLTAWDSDLRRFQTIASGGKYPGGAALTSGLALTRKLLAVRESFHFLEAFLTAKNDLMDLGDDYHDLKHFFEQQKPVWEGLQVALVRFAPNRFELEKDTAAAAALSELEAITKLAAPYNRLKDVEPLIAQVEDVNAQLVEQRRARVLEKVDALIGQVEREATRTGASDAVSNQCLRPLQLLRERAKTESGVGNLQLFLSEATERADAAVELLEKAQSAPTPSPVATPTNLVKEPPSPPPAVRPSKIIAPMELMKKPYLETESDVQEFIDALTKELFAALAEKTRIRIR
ncbi:BREX system P-loop protein BrxC [Armatimonas sp.]|uniref:BREX system P-loop protein BrxC n=1 Tax=Armatimonas sp. TaxID=1872638 RepID=UPI003750B2B4